MISKHQKYFFIAIIKLPIMQPTQGPSREKYELPPKVRLFYRVYRVYKLRLDFLQMHIEHNKNNY